MRTREKIIVGMSGGVDSSVAAALLQQQGYQVEGLFMKNWQADDDEQYCSAAQDLKDAQAICDQLCIHLHTVNFSREYWDLVFETFLSEYQAGRTPNPDILCNKEIKFKAFLQYATQLGADKIATGHYAKISRLNSTWQLQRGTDANKDQSYFLYTLGQAELANALFPIGELNKTTVRQLAHQWGFVNHAKKDSTGICFIGERRFREFLQQFLPAQAGVIEDENGRIIGEHAGAMYYTIGQRQGLQLGGKQAYQELPWYVARKDIQRNVLVVVQGHDHPDLFQQQATAKQLHWVSGIENLPKLETPYYCSAKIRYRQADSECEVRFEKCGSSKDQAQLCARVKFNQAQWAITPGQSIVFYDFEGCLGGGVLV